ncbi:MAG: SAM hydroxide adenosyltransferase, partial [bacterium]
SADDLTSAGIALGDRLDVRIPGRALRMPFVVSFGGVPKGKPLAYINSSGNFALAVNEGDFSKTYDLREDAAIIVRKMAPPAPGNQTPILESFRP